MNSTYQLALKMEKEGYFLVAYPLFKECLHRREGETGDVLFHCGWCAENTKIADKQLALSFYMEAINSSCSTVCTMNSYFRAGWIQMNSKKFSEAIDLFKKAIELGHSQGEFNSIYTDALYWCAVSLEASKRYLDAINLYRAVRGISKQLNPESRYREIVSLVSIGRYSEAYNLCLTFNQPAPDEFSTGRYAELKELVKKELDILECCFNDDTYFLN